MLTRARVCVCVCMFEGMQIKSEIDKMLSVSYFRAVAKVQRSQAKQRTFLWERAGEKIGRLRKHAKRDEHESNRRHS